MELKAYRCDRNEITDSVDITVFLPKDANLYGRKRARVCVCVCVCNH